jgi:hypothetical protein
MNVILIKEKIEVGNRLEQLGLSREKLIEGIDAMVGGRASCTDNDPPSAPGYSSWREGTRRMREVLIPDGWAKSEDGQLSSVYNKDLNIKLVVSNTDAGTGLDYGRPQNNSKKGAATEQAIYGNQTLIQENFDAKLNITLVPHIPHGFVKSEGAVCWYLLVYTDGDIVRSELSCPTGIKDGFFTDFSERIIIIGDGDDYNGGRRFQDTPNDAPDATPEFDISVIRKQSA